MWSNLRLWQKLSLMALLTSFLPLLAFSSFSYLAYQKSSRAQAFSRNSTFFETKRELLKSYFEERIGDVSVMAEMASLGGLLERYREDRLGGYESMKAFLRSYARAYGYPEVFLTDERGVVLAAASHERELEGVDLSGRAYIKRSLGGETNWSEMFYSEFLRDTVKVLSAPVRSRTDGKVMGTVNLVVGLLTLSELVFRSTDKLGDSGDAYLILEDGLLVTKPKYGKLEDVMKLRIRTRAQERISGAISRGERDFLETDVYPDYRGVSVLGTFGVLDLAGERLGFVVEVDEEEAMADSRRLGSYLLMAIGVLVLLDLALVLLISKSLTGPIHSLEGRITLLGTGDLRVDISARGKDEIAHIASILNSTREKLRSMLLGISQISAEVDESSRRLAGISSDFRRTMTLLLEEMEGMDGEAQRVSASTEETSGGLNQISSSAREISDKARSLSAKAAMVSSTSREGENIVRNVSRAMQETKEKARSTESVVIGLREKAKNIGEIVEAISSIAEQTNLLALNAAIEAARAGEAGRGFAVVADEIRKLAEESRKATESISQILGQIQLESEKASSSTEDTVKSVEESFRQTEETRDRILKVIGEVEEMSEMVEGLARAVEEQSRAVQSISEATSSVADLVQSIASRVDSLTREARERLREAEEITELSTKLYEASAFLNQQVGNFKV